MWQYDIKNNKAELIYPLYAVKSVCNSADGVLMLYPTTEWWSDGLINEKGKNYLTSTALKSIRVAG